MHSVPQGLTVDPMPHLCATSMGDSLSRLPSSSREPNLYHAREHGRRGNNDGHRKPQQTSTLSSSLAHGKLAQTGQSCSAATHAPTLETALSVLSKGCQWREAVASSQGQR